MNCFLPFLEFTNARSLLNYARITRPERVPRRAVCAAESCRLGFWAIRLETGCLPEFCNPPAARARKRSTRFRPRYARIEEQQTLRRSRPTPDPGGRLLPLPLRPDVGRGRLRLPAAK